MFKHIVLFGLAAQPAMIWAANNFGEVVAGTQGLGNVAQGADEDVKAVNLVTGVTTASKIAGDIQNLGRDIQGVQSDAAGVAPSGADATEEQLSDAFDGFTDSFTLFLTDLREKANDLNDLGQGGAISTALEDIKPIYQDFAGVLASLVEDDDEKDAIDEAAEDGISAIAETQDEFQTAALPPLRMSRMARAKL